MSSRICIDGFNLALAKGSGIATYGRNLLDAIEGLGLEGEVLFGPHAGISRRRPLLNEVALTDAFTPRARPLRRAWETATARFGREAWPVEPSGEVIWPARGGGRPKASRFWSAPRLFHVANRAFASGAPFTPVRFSGPGAPDIMHWTTALPLKAVSAANVYTVHDLIPLRLPHATLDNKRAFFRLMRQVGRRADHIATVSDATRADLIRILGVDEARVTTTWQAVSLPERLLAVPEAVATDEIERVFRVPWKGYFLFYGAVEPKKNLARVTEAYLASGAPQPLIVVGGDGWLEEDELALLKQARRDDRQGFRKRIRVWKHLPFSMLVQLVRGARATLFPSLYEGFGLPVLESMLLGTPVITSTAGSLPEVAGEAALLVNPYDARALSHAIRSLAHDDDLAADLAQRGLIQARRFSPEAHQTRLADVYRRLGAG